MFDHTEPSRLHVPHIGRGRTDHRGLWVDRVAAVYVHTALFQVVSLLSRALGTTDVRLDGAVQRARVCGAFVTSSFIFCIITQGLGEGLDRPILLSGDGQHVQLCLRDLWFRVYFCGPLLVFHTSEQVAAPGTDRAGLAHRRGSPRPRGDTDDSSGHNVNPSEPQIPMPLRID